MINKHVSKEKVLIVLGQLSVGGEQSHVLDILRYSDREKFQFDICEMASEPGIQASVAENLGATVYQCSLRQNPFLFFYRFAKIVKAGNYDTVHIHRYDVSAFPLLIAKWCGVNNRIIHYHNVNSLVNKSLNYHFHQVLKRINKKNATSICGCSKNVLQSHFGESIANDKLFKLVYNGVDLQKFARTQSGRDKIRNEFEVPEGEVLIGNCSRIDKQKNPLFFVKAAIDVLKQHSNVKFVWVGDGPMHAEVAELIDRSGFQDKISILPFRTDICDVLSAFDILFFPSLWEGFPVLLLEAQAAGAVCATSLGAYIEEALCPEMYMHSFDNSDISSAVSSLGKMITDTELRVALAEAGLKFIRRFSSQNTINQLQKLYEGSA